MGWRSAQEAYAAVDRVVHLICYLCWCVFTDAKLKEGFTVSFTVVNSDFRGKVRAY